MLFQMLAGVLPFRGESMSELMYKIANEEAPDIRSMRAELPESLANIVALSLSKLPETRYQDGGQFAADLRAVLADLATGAQPIRPPGKLAVAGAGSQLPVRHCVPATVDFEKTALSFRPDAKKPGTGITSTDIEI